MAAYEEVRAQIDRESLIAHLDEFSRWTKHAGTPEELESLRYVERQMRAYGFEAEIVTHPAYISLPGAARVEVSGKRLHAIVHSFSRPSPEGGVEGVLVYAGTGKAADYANQEDVRGKIVLLDGVASPAAAVEAARRGALAQLHVSPHQHLHEMCISPVWGSPGDDDLEKLPRSVVVSISSDDGRDLKAGLERGEVIVQIFAEVETGWRETPILVADLPGPKGSPDEPFILFTGHHDTWYFGVMDNGGANATMLEVARLCAQHREQWKRGLRVIYWSGHSQGRYSSSAWYADQNWFELERRALVHVNVDSTGGLGNTVVSDTTAAAELAALASDALQAEAGQTFSGRRKQRAGDQSFWGIGVPAIYGNMSEQPAKPGELNASAAVFGGGDRMGAGTGWWWHTPDDLRDKMDPDLLVRDTRIYLRTVWRLLTDSLLPLDYREQCAHLRLTLEKHAEQAKAHLDLASLVELARRLQQSLEGLYSDPPEAGLFNETLRRLGRALVPVDYTYGDRFVHDPALSLPELPALGDCARLQALSPGSAGALHLASRLKRAANKVEFQLRTALEACERASTGRRAEAP